MTCSTPARRPAQVLGTQELTKRLYKWRANLSFIYSKRRNCIHSSKSTLICFSEPNVYIKHKKLLYVLVNANAGF